MQRFDTRGWGLNFRIELNKPTSGTMQLLSKEWLTHYGLNDRVSGGQPKDLDAEEGNTFRATSNDLDCPGSLSGKVVWGEKFRKNEPDILMPVAHIPEIEVDIRDRIPKFPSEEELSDMSTGKIRGRLRLDSKAGHVLYVLAFCKLRPITELVGDEFLRAFWATVRCHLMLWQNDIYHRDVSPSNFMHYRDEVGNVVGVLNDFDLASTSDHATGTERTGTVPFMALDLLTKPALRGEVMHLYEHDAESFIWVLTWISLRYSNGKPLKNAELDKWLIVDA
ncbi:hypothetical protein F5I97DRAFT_128491 [Phlebopus sp. FC_14]|nr:hypothetical protein F5I97DRAFT_128491 [Phlebopus sp. FC_14]